MIQAAFSKSAPAPGALVFRADAQGRSFHFAGFEDARPEAETEEALKCEERLRETHHRVKNNLQMIASMLAMQARQDGAGTRQALALAANRIMAVAKLHEQLQSGGAGTVEISDYLAEVCGALATSAGCEDRDVSIEVEAVPHALCGGRATGVGLIVTELVTNAMKHAFGDRGGAIRVSFAPLAGGLLLTVADDGSGFPPGAKPGLGLTLVHQMAAKLGGSLCIDTAADGTVFSLDFAA